MSSSDHFLDPMNKCGDLTHDIDISVTISLSVYQMLLSMLARNSIANQAARSGVRVFSHGVILAER